MGRQFEKVGEIRDVVWMSLGVIRFQIEPRDYLVLHRLEHRLDCLDCLDDKQSGSRQQVLGRFTICSKRTDGLLH